MALNQGDLSGADSPGELLPLILNNTLDGIVTIDDQGVIRIFNRAAERLFGYSASEVIGRNVSLLMPEPDRGRHDGHIARYLRTGEAHIIGVGRRVTGSRKDGSTVPIDLAITEFTSANRRYFVGICRDRAADERDTELAAVAHRLSAVLDGMVALVGVLSTDGIVLDINDAALKAAELQRDDVVGKHVTDTYWVSHSQTTRESVRRAVQRAAAGESVRGELSIRAAEGHPIVLDTLFTPLRDISGRVVQVLGSGVDVTDRSRAEEELRRRLRQQRAIADLGSVALKTRAVESMLNETVKTVSQVLDNELCKVLELRPGRDSFVLRAGVGWSEGLVGHAVVDAGLDSQAGYTLLSDAPVIVDDLRSETRFSGPQLLHDHGVVSGMSVVIQGSAGPYGVLGTHTRQARRFTTDDVNFLVSVSNVLSDFITRREIEAQAQKESALSHTLLEGLPGIVYVLDEHGRLRRWNRMLESVSGYAASELDSANAIDLVPPGERSFMGDRIREVFEHGHASAEAHVRTKDGRLIPYLFSGLKLVTDATYLVGVAVDVSDRRQLQDQLRQAQKMEAFGQLAGGVAHDFNNVLTVVLGCAEFLLESLPPDSQERADVQAIADAGSRAASLTKQLLSFSRQAVVEPIVLDLNATVLETLKMLSRLIGEDVRLHHELSSDLWHVKLDPGQLGQVLMNLAINARDAMPQGGTLTIETRNLHVEESFATSHPGLHLGDYATLAVTDTGRGMTPETKSRVFEPFFTTKSLGRGSGLGLAVVYGIVKQSGGYIDVYSEPELGTSFKVYFPAIDAQVTAAPSDATGTASGGTATVLLVEDEESVRRFVHIVLKKLGYTVLDATSGDEAIRRAEQSDRAIDLLVTDVVMPGRSGLQVAEVLRRRFPRLKVLFLSGYTDDAVIRHGILHDKVSLLQKPFSSTVLARKVREVLNQPSRP